jgi:large subunit ribosomal protein L25
MNEVAIIALPKDLPEYIWKWIWPSWVWAIRIHLSQVSVPAGVVIVALSHGPDHDLPVVSVLKPRGTAVEEEGEGGEAAEGGEEVGAS